MKKSVLLLLLLLILTIIVVAPCYGAKDEIVWTDAEQEFMEKHPVIRLGVDPRFVPFEFIDDDGEYKGIACDYLELVAKRTGLKFDVQKGLTWPEAYELALSGEVDALPAIGKTTEREEHFLFSKPYYYFKRVIATRDTDVHISSMEDLEGKTVAVQRNSSHHSYLLSFEHINLSLYDSVESALTAVATGDEVAFIGNLATTNYLIRTSGLTALRFVAFEAEKQQALYFAVREDLPELVDIFDKAMDFITEQERTAINNKWIDLETHLDYGPIIRVVSTIGAIVGLVMLVSFYWIGKLRNEIQRRKLTQNQLEKANEELEKISMVDGLTGISNRRYFDSFLEKVWGINLREKFPLALIMIDIDDFKVYNDTYGHLAGDQCLINVAKAINNTVKRSGDFVARYGGEEFSVILSNTIEDDAAFLAEKIRVKVENMIIENEGIKTNVTVSLGVAAIVTSEGVGPNELINAADDALYQAKKEGKNKVVAASSLK